MIYIKLYVLLFLLDPLDNAISKKQMSIYSPAFYVHPNGYKICLRLYVNGDLTGKDAYVSLFYVIKRGEHDDTLRWPFNLQAVFTLIDQSNIDNEDGHVVKSCWPDQQFPCFSRPKYDMNAAYGLPDFCPVGFLDKDLARFVQNDCMLIKVQFKVLDEETSTDTSLLRDFL